MTPFLPGMDRHLAKRVNIKTISGRIAQPG